MLLALDGEDSGNSTWWKKAPGLVGRQDWAVGGD